MVDPAPLFCSSPLPVGPLPRVTVSYVRFDFFLVGAGVPSSGGRAQSIVFEWTFTTQRLFALLAALTLFPLHRENNKGQSSDDDNTLSLPPSPICNQHEKHLLAASFPPSALGRQT